MKNWGYNMLLKLKITFSEKWKSIISTFFAIIGAIYTIAEIIYQVFNSSIAFNLIKANCVGLLIIITIISVALNWKKLEISHFIKSADTKITIKVCDIFKQSGAFVIPTNTTFDTIMDNEFISRSSVQGQYQIRFFPNSSFSLDQLIEAGLSDIPYTTLVDGRKTKDKRYNIGTVCKITTPSPNIQHAYFLAVADINKYGKTENVTFEKITEALVSLWQNLNIKGHMEPILIPIIGTGKAGIKDASRDKIIQEIIFSFVNTAKEMKVTEHLVICVHPKDFAEKNLHWDDLHEYLRYICKYQISEHGSVEGTSENDTQIQWGNF